MDKKKKKNISTAKTSTAKILTRNKIFPVFPVKDLTGNTVYDPERINNTFRDFKKNFIFTRGKPIGR